MFSFFKKCNFAVLAVLVGFLSSCDSQPKEVTTAEGVRYTKHTNAEGTFPDSASIIDMHYSLYAPGDSLVSSTYQAKIPTPMPFQFQQAPYFKEILMKATAGDSFSVHFPAELMFAAGGGQLPPFLKEGDEMRMEIKVEGIYSMTDYQSIMMERRAKQQEQMMKLAEESKAKEDVAIQDYLSQNNMEAQKTADGMYYMIETQGDTTGIAAGDTAVVHYRGTLLDGTPFDNSYDRGTPFKFPLMQGRVIRGWDQGVPLIGKGGKGTLLIPSHLAYGGSARSEVIQPFSTLKFDIEVLEVLPAPETAEGK